MRTSSKGNIKRPTIKFKPRTSSDFRMENSKIPRFSSTQITNPPKNPQMEEDEFWKDCVDLHTMVSSDDVDTARTKELSNKQNIEDDYLTFNEEKIETNFIVNTNNSQISSLDKEHKFKRLINKLGYDSNEAKLKTVLISQQKASIERCHLLYEKGKIKNEVNKLMFVKNNEIKEKQELSECTFKPRTNSAKNLFSRKVMSKIDEKEKNMYERSIYLKKKASDRIDREKTSQIKINDECTFKPQLNTIDVAQIFDPKNNVINDFYSRNYMNRLQNARNEEKIKKEKLIPSTKLYDKICKNNCIRSTSMENTFSHEGNLHRSIKNLHNELHSLTLETF